jgi:hypothetical protein
VQENISTYIVWRRLGKGFRQRKGIGYKYTLRIS